MSNGSVKIPIGYVSLPPRPFRQRVARRERIRRGDDADEAGRAVVAGGEGERDRRVRRLRKAACRVGEERFR